MLTRCIVVAALALSTCAVRDARASVSIAVAVDELVSRADAAAVVVPLEKRSAWEKGRIATYTHLRVDRLVAGTLAAEFWVRALGGAVGRIGQLVEGEATFAAGKPSLVFVHESRDGTSSGTFAVVEGAQGQFALATDGGPSPRLALAQSGGALLAPPHATRLARDVLVGKSLEDAARVIQAAWSHKHGASAEGGP